MESLLEGWRVYVQHRMGSWLDINNNKYAENVFKNMIISDNG